MLKNILKYKIELKILMENMLMLNNLHIFQWVFGLSDPWPPTPSPHIRPLALEPLAPGPYKIFSFLT